MSDILNSVDPASVPGKIQSKVDGMYEWLLNRKFKREDAKKDQIARTTGDIASLAVGLPISAISWHEHGMMDPQWWSNAISDSLHPSLWDKFKYTAENVGMANAPAVASGLIAGKLSGYLMNKYLEEPKGKAKKAGAGTFVGHGLYHLTEDPGLLGKLVGAALLAGGGYLAYKDFHPDDKEKTSADMLATDVANAVLRKLGK